MTANPAIDGALRALLSGGTADWPSIGATPDAFVEACRREEVEALVDDRLRGLPRRAGWPREVLGELGARARAAAARELTRQRELARVLEALAAAGVQPVLIKGTALAYTVYPAPAWRPRQDTDLLVRRDDLPAVRRAMQSLGYSAPPYCDGDLLFHQFALAKVDTLGTEHVFDVHWKISTQAAFADILSYADLAAGAVPVPALGPHARAAGALHALLIACIHPVMHHRNAGRLLWRYDLHLLASGLLPGELEQFAELAEEQGVGPICARALTGSQEAFGTPVPPGVLSRLGATGNAALLAYLNPGRRWHHELLSSLRALRWRDRLTLIREVLLPPPRYMLGAYGITSRAHGFALLPALYLHRNVYGIWKILAGRK